MSWSQLPGKLRALILIVTAIALPIVCWAVWTLLQHPPENSNWLVLTVLTLLTVPFFLFLPSVNTIVNIGDAYIMAVAMLYGPAPCVVATLCHILAASLFAPNRRKIYAYRVVFNVASMVCNAFIYSNVYALVHSLVPRDMILPSATLTLTFFFFNSLLTATAMAWASGDRVLQFWSRHCMPLAIDFSVSAVCATLLASLKGLGSWVPLAGAPIIGLIWGWNKLNKAKTMEAEQHLKEQEQLYLRTVESLALAVDAKDQTTYGHIRRVRAYAMVLAKLHGITDTKELMAIETGSLLHDIGKLAIDDYILNKPGRLSKQEFEKMKMHAPAGDEILQQIQFPFPVAKYVRAHHEKWDGTGYPDGLKAEQIPLGARILSIADAFDAIRSSRPYKLSFGIQDSVELLRAQSGTMYDPDLLELFIAHIDELDAAAVEATKNIPQLSFRNYSESLDSSLSSSPPPFPYPTVPSTAPAELVGLNEFCTSVGDHLQLSEILPILSQRLGKLLPFSTCIFFLDTGADALKADHVAGKFADSLRGITIGLGKAISGWAAAYRRPILNTGPALEFQDLDGDFTSLTDTLVVPLILDGLCIGTISLYAEAPIFYSQAHLALLQIVSSHVTPLIARVRSKPEPGSTLIDPVTRLHRISYLSVAGSQMISSAERNQAPLSLLYLDLQNLDHVTSLYGPPVRDSILRKIAEMVRTEFRETDLMVRFGMQAFVALLAGVRTDQALRLTQRLHHHIRTSSAALPGQHFHVSCQIGLATYPQDGSTPLALLESAQRSLYAPPATSTQDAAVANRVVEFPPRT